MIVNPEILEELSIDAGDKRTQKARAYALSGRVEIEEVHYSDENNFEIKGSVQGQGNIYTTNINVEDGEILDVTCECEDYYSRFGVCKHILATLMYFSRSKQHERAIKTNKANLKYRSFMQLVNQLYQEEMQELEKETSSETHIQEKNKISIEPKLLYDKYYNSLKVEFDI